MGRYKVQHDYQSSLGAFDKGAVAEIDDSLADHLNRDSPGLLKAVKTKKTETGAGEKANAGNIDQVLARVGDDAEAAAAALQAEQAEKQPRTSLVAALEELIAGPAGDDDGDE